jgi:hypothetical protein
VPLDAYPSVLTISLASLNSALHAALALYPVPGVAQEAVTVIEATIKSEMDTSVTPSRTSPFLPVGSVAAAVVLSVVGGALVVALGRRCCSAPRDNTVSTLKAREEEDEQEGEQTGLKEG